MSPNPNRSLDLTLCLSTSSLFPLLHSLIFLFMTQQFNISCSYVHLHLPHAHKITKCPLQKNRRFLFSDQKYALCFFFSSPNNLLVRETCRFRCGKSSTYNSLVFFVLAYSSFLFIRSSSAAPAEAATFYQPLYCLSLPLSIRADKVAVSSVSDSNITFSRVSHSP